MRKKRDTIISDTIKAYITTHHPDEETLVALNEKLLEDADLLSASMDKSIIRASIQRARYTFWISAIIGTSIVIALAAFPITTSIAPFFVPLIAAFVSWAVALGTIPIGYIHSVKGAMESAIIAFEADRKEKLELEKGSTDVEELRSDLRRLQRQLTDLSSQSLQSLNHPERHEYPGMKFWNAAGAGQELERVEVEGDEVMRPNPLANLR